MKRAAVTGLKWYRQYRSVRPNACRFDPSCSGYMLEAVETHGVLRGGYLGVRRVLRCHPWGGQGYDPVPAPSDSVTSIPTTPHPSSAAGPIVGIVDGRLSRKKQRHA